MFASPGRPPRIETPALDPDSTTPGCSAMMLRTSLTGKSLTMSPDTIDFEVTWSRGTIGFEAVTLMVPTWMADGVSFTLTVIVWPPNTRVSRCSDGA